MTLKRNHPAWLIPDWPAPVTVRACVSTRSGGISLPPYYSLNLGDHVGDNPQAVAANRAYLRHRLGCHPAWLQQIHGIDVVYTCPNQTLTADGQWTDQPGIAATVLTADCLPLLFCNRQGTRVAAAHAGWRGLAGGIIEATVTAMGGSGKNLLAWLGPAIGPLHFEVGPEVRQVFTQRFALAARAFTPSKHPDKWLADLYQLARLYLAACDVTAVSGGGFCTFTDTQRFYSFRRSNCTGRFASLVWLTPR